MSLARREFFAATAAVFAIGRRAFAGPQTSTNKGGDVIPKFHRDANGLIVQADGDGGDTAQREGFVWFGLYIRRKKLGLSDPTYIDLKLTFPDTIQLLEVNKSGLFRRHP